MSQIDIICFDKTGVLTTREMEVKKIYFPDTTLNADNLFHNGKLSNLIKLGCALCNDVNYFEKIDSANPIDKALISLAQENGVKVNEILSRYKRIYDKPFDSENRYMASGFEKDGEVIYFAKGDPSVILKMCQHYLTTSGDEKSADLDFWMLNVIRRPP